VSPEKKPIARKACAKINLTFEVLGKRGDGYHEVLSIMQAISLCDVLVFEPHEQIRLACEVPELVSPTNLVYKAARLMQGLAQENRGVSISLTKGIPLASGLGGGSSDAAVTMQVLNEMWNINISQGRLAELAGQLGSDVPFFLGNSPTALATGRGEKVETLPSLAKTWVVLLRPPMDMVNKTRGMYGLLNPSHFTDGRHAERMAGLIEQGKRITTSLCYNVFDDLSSAFFGGIEDYRSRFLAAGAGEVRLAGAGPTLFTLVDGRAAGEEICRRLKKDGMEAYLAETI